MNPENANKIFEFHLVLESFLGYFNIFRDSKIIDINVAESLKTLVLNIDKLLDQSEIVNNKTTMAPFDVPREFEKNEITLFPFHNCGICNQQVSGKKLMDHLKSEKHIMRISLKNKLGNIDSSSKSSVSEITTKLSKTSIDSTGIKSESVVKKLQELARKSESPVPQKPAINDKHILPFIPTNSKSNSQEKLPAIKPFNGKDLKELSLDELLKLSKSGQNNTKNLPETKTSQNIVKEQKPVQQKPTVQKQPKQQKQSKNKIRKELERKADTIRVLSPLIAQFLKNNNLDTYVASRIIEGECIMKSKATEGIILNLLTILKDRYPNITFNPFGSRVSGLGIAGSDLDVFVDLDNNLYYDNEHKMYSETAKIETLEHMKTVEKTIKKSSTDIRILYVVKDARVPLIRCMSIKHQFEIDLTFNNGAGVENTKFIQYIFKLQPVALQLSMFLKCWFKEFLTTTSTYMLTILVIFFLQTENLLPSVFDLQKEVEIEKISYWQYNFKEASLKELGLKKCKTDFKILALKLFNFYKEFSFREFMVCPFLGQKVPKLHFADPLTQLPRSMKSFIEFYSDLSERPAPEREKFKFAHQTAMVVQDPFILSFNMTKGLKMDEKTDFQNFCHLSHDMIKYGHVNMPNANGPQPRPKQPQNQAHSSKNSRQNNRNFF